MDKTFKGQSPIVFSNSSQSNGPVDIIPPLTCSQAGEIYNQLEGQRPELAALLMLKNHLGLDRDTQHEAACPALIEGSWTIADQIYHSILEAQSST